MATLLTVLSSLLLILAYPPFDLWWIPFLALSPFFWVLLKAGPIRGGLFGLLFGVVFYGGVLFWMNGLILYGVMGWQRSILWASLTLLLSLYPGLFGFGVGFLSKRMEGLAVLIVPVVWCSVEFLRGHFPLGGFPWVLLAHSQYMNLPIIQISTFTGAYGVSFILALVNVSLAQGLGGPGGLKRRVSSVLLALFITTGCWGWGAWVLLKREVGGESLKVSAIQGNFPIEMSWNWRDSEGEFRRRLTTLTRKALSRSPSLIVWTETIILEPIGHLPRLVKEFSSLLDGRSLLLLGAPHPFHGRYYNSAFLISKEGIIGRYDKIHLVPFGEYLPCEGFLPGKRGLIPQAGNFIKGSHFTVFDVDGIKFSVFICFEGIFPSLVRRFVKEGATFLVNITNDAWSISTSSHLQHFQSLIFRAVENRCYIVRAGNTGVSAFIDPYGRVRERLPINVSGFIFGKINPTIKEETIYTRWGDLFSWVCVMVVVALILFGVVSKKGRLFL
jgi:apolipoprotein N-acyltransferase